MDVDVVRRRTIVRVPSLADVGRQAGSVILGAVDSSVESRWELARRRAAATTASDLDGRIREVRNAFARELATFGAAAGGVAAAPAFGTATTLATAAGELGWFTVRAADLVLTVAALHGHDAASVQERRAWVLGILAFGDSASRGITRVAGEVGSALGGRLVARVPATVLARVNASLGRTVVTKYGTKRGVIALGRVVPFGIGAVIGGSANYVAAHTLARQADTFFRQLPPVLADVDVVGAREVVPAADPS